MASELVQQIAKYNISDFHWLDLIVSRSLANDYCNDYDDYCDDDWQASETSETIRGNKWKSEIYIYIYTPSTRQRLVYKNDIPLLRRRDIPLLRRPVSWA